jgi:hypothetical protein
MNRMMLVGFLACLCSISISTAGTWNIETVDNTAYDAGSYCSLAVIDGQPAIAYNYYYDPYNLRYARYNGSSWDYATADENAWPVGTSLKALPDGNPAIAYHDHDNEDLKYAWFDGSIWQNTIVEGAGNTGNFPSLAIVGGQPAISYFDYNPSPDVLKYARFNGATWDVCSVTPAIITGSSYTSMVVLPDGNPVIAFCSGSALIYAKYDGTTWIVITVTSTGYSSGYTSMAVLPDGNPAITYYDSNSKSLKYAAYNGSTWTTQEIYKDVYPATEAGLYSHLAILPNGQPAVSWYWLHPPLTMGKLQFSWLENGQWQTMEIDGGSYNRSGMYSSLDVLADNSLGIAYYNIDYGVLKFAKTDYPLSAAATETHYTATAWLERTGETVGIDEPASTSTYLCVESAYVSSYVNVESTMPGLFSGTIRLSGSSCTDGRDCRLQDEETGECLLWGKCLLWDEGTWECLEWIDPVIEEPNDASGHLQMQIQISATNAMPNGTPVYLHFLLSNNIYDPGLSETMYCRVYRNSELVEDLAADTEKYIPAQVGDNFYIDAYCYVVGNDGYYREVNLSMNITDEEGVIFQPNPDICGDGSAGPDGIVNLFDFNCLAAEWLNSPCEAEGWCNSADIDRSGDVGIGDLWEMAALWLQEIGGE